MILGPVAGRRVASIRHPGKEGGMSWTKVLPQENLPEGQRAIVEVSGRSILIIHWKGEIYAVDNECPHMGASLEGGKVTEDGALVCPRHHSAFDLRTGEVKEWSPWPPGVGRILGSVSKEKALPVYPTRTDEGSVWVSTQDPN
jgi:nitrite reductase/ring-hydroxylating ferredoxin subunit